MTAAIESHVRIMQSSLEEDPGGGDGYAGRSGPAGSSQPVQGHPDYGQAEGHHEAWSSLAQVIRARGVERVMFRRRRCRDGRAAEMTLLVVSAPLTRGDQAQSAVTFVTGEGYGRDCVTRYEHLADTCVIVVTSMTCRAGLGGGGFLAPAVSPGFGVEPAESLAFDARSMPVASSV